MYMTTALCFLYQVSLVDEGVEWEGGEVRGREEGGERRGEGNGGEEREQERMEKGMRGR